MEHSVSFSVFLLSRFWTILVFSEGSSAQRMQVHFATNVRGVKKGIAGKVEVRRIVKEEKGSELSVRLGRTSEMNVTESDQGKHEERTLEPHSLSLSH